LPVFSIILPTYNRVHFLPRAIESVIGQSFLDWELIIVDDGSTDNTKEVVSGYSDERILYFYQKNQERSAARNNGISQSQGKFICFLDSDDYYLEKKLTNLFSSIQLANETPAIWYDGLRIETESEIDYLPFPERKNLSIYDFIISSTLFSQQICGSRQIFEKCQFDPTIRIGEDMELWMRIANEFPFIPIDNSFETVIVEHDNRSVNLKKFNAASEQLDTLRSIFSKQPGLKVSAEVRKLVLSNCHFNIAKHHMLNERAIRAAIEVVRSILMDEKNIQTRHRFYCLSKLFLGKIPMEYRNQ
jgi:glycosyltransferase involved in cell wall biosynthesis